VEHLAELVDGAGVDVYAFGISTDFRGRLFPGAQRLLELADSVQQLQVEVLCWCGRPGLLNARVVGGRLVRVADTGGEADVHYQVLYRAHHRSGDLGPAVPAPGQLTIR